MKIIDFVAIGSGDSDPQRRTGWRFKTVIKIKVVTRQPKTEFFWVLDDGTLKIRLKAVPENWKANKELIRFLADELGVKTFSIDIISGATDSMKLVQIKS